MPGAHRDWLLHCGLLGRISIDTGGMSPLGVIECFYGRPWPEQERQSYAAFLKSLEFDFYIYAPKGDGALRKDWRLPFTPERMLSYRRLRDHFVGHGLQFGMALSPHALYGDFDQAQRQTLLEKTKALSDLGLDYLGLFFDDMARVAPAGSLDRKTSTAGLEPAAQLLPARKSSISCRAAGKPDD